MFTSLSYSDYKIIGYPTEIFNEKYKRSKIEFNFCLVLKNSEFEESDVFNLKKAKERKEEEVENSSDDDSSSIEDDILRLGDNVSENSDEDSEIENDEEMLLCQKLTK